MYKRMSTASPVRSNALYPTPTRVLIVDDHPLVRQGLIGLIAPHRDFEICGEASGIKEAQVVAATARADVAIIDLTLEDGNGIELIKQFKEKYPEMKLLVVSMHEESLFAERALRAGASGYVSKREAIRTIVQAVRTVLAGKVYLSQTMTERVVQWAVDAKAEHSRAPLERLTDREIEIFEMIGRGLTSQEIARKLQLSPKTVATYREHVKEKLELKNGAELTRHAVQWVLDGR
jgi:DNA-binding NarL/FixJ family response regulator